MSSLEKIINELSLHEKEVLLSLHSFEGKSTPEDIAKNDVGSLVKVMNASSWLQSKGIVDIHEKLETIYSLTKEGKKFLTQGMPERQALTELINSNGQIDLDTLGSKIGKDNLAIALGWLKKRDWATLQSKDNKKVILITPQGKKDAQHNTQDEDALKSLKEGSSIQGTSVSSLKKRGAIKEKEKILRTISLTQKGKNILKKGLDITDVLSQLTPELIQTGKWKTATFRPYDVSAFVPSLYGGKKHPLTQLIDKIKSIFVGMGFQEIAGNYVESCFWTMDVLFIPQDHPARDLQDTFYCKQPPRMPVDKHLLDSIANVHENGGSTSSTGWQYKFSKKEAQKSILRTHTTVNTIRYLYEHPDPPSKIFQIGKVFRRENIDSTHLPEFQQVEGIVHEKNANFCQLIGILKEFYHQLGFEKLRFRPAYFPYTEPSMEVEVQWHGKWMELGGSGIFRPEVTEPLGIKETVLAWGLGLERIAIMYLGLNDIRELYFSDLDWLKKLPLL